MAWSSPNQATIESPSKIVFKTIFEARDLQIRAQRHFLIYKKQLKSNFHQNQLPKPKIPPKCIKTSLKHPQNIPKTSLEHPQNMFKTPTQHC